MDRNFRISLLLFEFGSAAQVIAVSFRHADVVIRIHEAVPLDDRIIRDRILIHQHLFVGTAGQLELPVMDQVVFAVNRIEAVEAARDIRADPAVGAGAFYGADKGTVGLSHSKDRERVFSLADGLCSFHAVIPAVQVGVISVLGQFSVIVPDDTAAAFRNEDESFFLRPGCAEHRQNGNISQRVLRLILDLIIGNFHNQLVSVQPKNHRGIEVRAVVLFLLFDILHVDLILFLVITDLGEIAFNLFLALCIGICLQDVQVPFLNGRIHGFQFVQVGCLPQLLGVKQGIEGGYLLLVSARHLAGQFLIPVLCNGDRDNICPFDFTDGIFNPKRIVIFFIDVEVLVYH